MENINIAELLKDCPPGMELNCTMYEGRVTFVKIDENDTYPIIINVQHNGNITIYQLTKTGQPCIESHTKCIIFPKGKTTWDGFHRPFKDGDIIHVCDEYSDATFNYVAIIKQIETGGKIHCYCFYNFEEDYFNTNDFLYDINNTRFATEEEKQKLFDAVKADGYKWNPETKTLEKLIEPKFKDGDIISDLFNSVCIFKREGNLSGTVDFYCGSDYIGNLIIKDINKPDSHFGNIDDYKLATEEEKQKLFDTIGENGYQWNSETKTLEESNIPKYKFRRCRTANDLIGYFRNTPVNSLDIPVIVDDKEIGDVQFVYDEKRGGYVFHLLLKDK